ncbi:MAG: TldD/PmbA family protein [Chloroflexi bacterium]|nr:TldD/PmbA family protein [Chloroflexota bacterium]
MISINGLRKAVGTALEYLHSVPDVKEAEVFISSNGCLFTRLNYTSHIPSNGVEEPKSTENLGVGLRVVFETQEGTRTGFGSEPSDISLAAVRSALEKARRAAVTDPEFVSLPRPTGEARSIDRYHDIAIMQIEDRDVARVGWVTLDEALDTLGSSEELLSLVGSKESLPGLGLIVGGDVTILQERMAIASYSMPKIQTDQSTLIMAFITAMIEREYAKGSDSTVWTRLADFSGEPGRKAAQNAIASVGGVRVKDGAYKVILGRQAVTDLLHNIIIPSLQLGTFYAVASPFLGKLGKTVASDTLTIYDHGALPGYAGTKGITCEGIPTGRTDLIKDGVLVGLLANYYESQRMLSDPKAKEKLGVDPREHRQTLVPRNGFRFTRGGGRHFDTPPGTFGTNIIVEGKERCTHEELLRRVGDGLYIGRIWYTYPINGLAPGDFTCTVVGESFLIKDGRLSTPLKPNTVRINDNIHNILNSVLGVGDNVRSTLVWAADQIVYAPEMAVANVHVKEIAEFMETV